MAADVQRVSFKNGNVTLAGEIRFPPGFDPNEKYAALVIAIPGSSVKEQVGAFYGQRMAQRGFVTIAFDPSFQGESGGEPRDLEDPAARVEDIRCAVDFLTTQSFVSEGRIGVLGVCAGGGYAVNAAMTDHRIRAIGTVVAVNIGRAFRRAAASAEAVASSLEAVGRERTSEARGGEVRREKWIPDSLEEAETDGISDQDVLQAVQYYRTSRGHHGNSTNRRLFRSDALLLGFDAFHLAEELLAQPIFVIVGGRRGSTYSFDDGREIWERATTKKEFCIIDGAGHYEMYDTPRYVDQAVERLEGFYKEHLGA